MKVEFINLGRSNISNIIEVKNEKDLYAEIQKHLCSRNWDLWERDELPGTCDVVAGFRTVGQVKILEP